MRDRAQSKQFEYCEYVHRAWSVLKETPRLNEREYNMNRMETAKAFIQGINGRCHNAWTDGTTYWLHGHPIATKYGLPGKYVVVFDWCDWYTPTTANHMNDILAVGNGPFRVGYSSARKAGQTKFEVALEV